MAVALAGLIICSGCAAPGPVPAVLSLTPTDHFYELVKDAGVEATLAEGGPYTVFAPTDDALARASGQIADLEQNRERLRSVVLSHVVKDEALSQTDLTQRSTLTTANGKVLPVTSSGDRITVGGATIVGPGVNAKNGIVYPVDRLVTP